MRRCWIFAVLVGLHYFSLVTLIPFGNTILIIFRSITNFELVTQKVYKDISDFGRNSRNYAKYS